MENKLQLNQHNDMSEHFVYTNTMVCVCVGGGTYVVGAVEVSLFL